MLEHLSIRNIVLIQSLDLDFSEGLTVLTGETGAGKSILLDALTLALGERADNGLIRMGADSASVTAVFTNISPLAVRHIGQAGLTCDQNQIVLRRVVSRDKSSRAFLNDQPVTIQLLRSVSHALLDIHGQFDALSTASDYRQALDPFINDKDLTLEVKAAYVTWQESLKALHNHKALQSQGLAQLPFWKQAISEMETLNFKVGELEALEGQRAQMSHQGKVMEGLQEMLSSMESKAIPSLTEVSRILTKLAGLLPSFEPLSRQLESAYAEISDLNHTFQSQRHDLSQGASSLEAIESRLFAIRSLCRKFHIAEIELPSVIEEYRQKVAALEGDEAYLDRLTEQMLASKNSYENKAAQLRKARYNAATYIQELVMKELPDLRLPEAKFIIQVNPSPEEKWAEHGMDEVLFMVQTNASSSLGAIHAIASGGERSRLYLALKLALASAYPQMSFVFDEVDSGIGGATASAVGERLKRLASHVGSQVLVVTHSPQVAAFGRDHWHISKSTDHVQTVTQATRLSYDQRLEEIARMLSGSDVTVQARAAAQQLLQMAG